MRNSEKLKQTEPLKILFALTFEREQNILYLPVVDTWSGAANNRNVWIKIQTETPW